MTIMTVERRDRMTARRRIRYAQFKTKLYWYGHEPYTHQVCVLGGIEATWEAVRRVAGAILGQPLGQIPVPTAWALLAFVEDLPDGGKRLRVAAQTALAQWASEFEEEVPK